MTVAAADALQWTQSLRHRLAAAADGAVRLAMHGADDSLRALVLSEAWQASLRPAAVLVPLLQRDGEWQVVLTRRAEGLRQHGGQISFPGGKQDPGDRDACATALRETFEEIGVPPESVDILGQLDDQLTFSRFRITPVVGWLPAPQRWQPDQSEVAEVFELPLAWVCDIERYQWSSLTRDGLQIPFARLDVPGRDVWGATAAVLWDLCLRLNPGAAR